MVLEPPLPTLAVIDVGGAAGTVQESRTGGAIEAGTGRAEAANATVVGEIDEAQTIGCERNVAASVDPIPSLSIRSTLRTMPAH